MANFGGAGSLHGVMARGFLISDGVEHDLCISNSPVYLSPQDRFLVEHQTVVCTLEHTTLASSTLRLADLNLSADVLVALAGS